MSNYRHNYSFVIGNAFQPFSMQEMLVPFTAYKDAFEQTEAAYNDLTDKSDQFKYLSESLPEGSKARQIYEGYANELNNQALDLAQNGLSMGNRRALTNLKRRYQGEIGRLMKADEAMQEERTLRRTMNAKDSSMLYATDNLSIDDFIDNNTPNLYRISGNDLYTRGAAAGRAASSRVYSAGDEGSTLNGYYRRWVERNGYNKESIDAFRANAAAIPELQQAAEAILQEQGVTENLTGSNLERARQSVLNGIIDGAVYQESVKPVRDEGVMSASEKDASARGWAANTRAQQQMELSALQSGYKREGDKWVLDEEGLKKRAEVMGIASYNPDEWEVGPDGKTRKKKSSNSQSAEAKAENKKQTALLKLTYKDLLSNNGFDVNLGDDRQHYDYVGLMANSRGKWRVGAIGDDVPGHGWGIFSSNNLENGWGSFSMESVDGTDAKNGTRVLSPNELIYLLSTDDEFRAAFEEYTKDLPEDADIQLVEVPNESDSNKKGYAIAMRR